MNIRRRQFLRLAAGAAALPTLSRIARAQTYPTRPITMIVPIAAGGPADAVARLVAERMKGSLGQSITIENASGADGSIGAGRTARARPDGYTIEFGHLGWHVLNGALYSLQYDLLNDFAPIAPLGEQPLILLGKKALPANDLRELIAWLRANPDKVLAGCGSPTAHLHIALFQKEVGTRFALVPYRGGPPALQDLVAGQIDLLLVGPSQLPLARAGNTKAYAVTSDTRMKLAPDISTFAKMGLPALSFSEWLGLFAPKGTPKDIIGRLNAAAVEALADPAVQSRFLNIGVKVFPREQQTPEVLGALVKAGAEKWWPIIKELGIKAE
jgi:tripartite-type tricarboxylate transporter receptor subunit TctC